MATHIGRTLGAALAVVLFGVGPARAETPQPPGLSGGAATMTLGMTAADADAETVEVFYRPYYGVSYGYRYGYGLGYSNFAFRYSYGYPGFYGGYFPSYRYGGFYASYPSFYSVYPAYSYGGFYRFCADDAAEAATQTLDLRQPVPAEPDSPMQRMPLAQPPVPAPEADSSFPYDGGPDRPVPMPRAEPEPAPLPQTGDTLRISLPARPATETYRFRAYGEE